MSVCIASIADSGGTIVLATDQMVSSGFMSADHVMVKGEFLGFDWFVLWAANDITPIQAIYQRAILSLESEHGDTKARWALHEVSSALSKAYQAETLHRAVAEYLSPYGLNMPDFLSNGHHIFGDDYPVKRMEIEKYDLDIELLVAGFDTRLGRTAATIFSVGRRGHVSFYTKPGFWVIGSGHFLGMGSLALRGHNTARSTVETLYRVLEAKFSAERAPGVGRHTTALVLTPNTLPRMVPHESITKVRDIWEAQAKVSAPEPAISAIHEWWTPHRQSIARDKQAQVKDAVKRLSDDSERQSAQKGSTRGRRRQPPSQG